MTFGELVRLLERNGFRLVNEKGSIRYYVKEGVENLIRVDYHGPKEVPKGTCHAILKAAGIKTKGPMTMLELPYSLIIEATSDPTFFGFHSPDLHGFSGVGHSIEDCIYQAKWGMKEHVDLLREQHLSIPSPSSNPTVVIHNETHATSAA